VQYVEKESALEWVKAYGTVCWDFLVDVGSLLTIREKSHYC